MKGSLNNFNTGQTSRYIMSLEIKDVINLVGMQVKNHHGESLGRIVDVVIDEERNIPEYLILSCHDLFGDSRRYFAIPVHPLLINISKNNKITVPVEKDTLKVAPGIHINECPKFDPEISDSIFELLRYPDSSSPKDDEIMFK